MNKPRLVWLGFAAAALSLVLFWTAPRFRRAPDFSSTTNVIVTTQRNPRPTSPIAVPTAGAGISKPNVPSRLVGVLGLDPTLDFHARLAAIHRLRGPITTEELYALADFVRGSYDTTNRSENTTLKNDVLDALRELQVGATIIVPVLLDVFRDREQDSVMRDYALQHLVSWYDLADATGIQPALWDALGERRESLAGTALLGLHRLAMQHEGFDRAQIDVAAVNIFRDKQCGELARITAIQVCAQRQRTEVLSDLLIQVRGSKSIPTRIAAVAALGELGGKAEVAFLVSLARGPSAALQPAVHSALKRLRERLNPPKASL
jgi:HEAT repeat protein